MAADRRLKERGFSLVSALVSLSVVSVAGLAMAKTLGTQFKANAAIQLDMDLISVRRSIISRTDCAATVSRVQGKMALPRKGTTVPVDLLSESGRRVLAASPNGNKIGQHWFRADLNDTGKVVLMARSHDAANPSRKILHPMLGHDMTNWRDTSPGGAELCDASSPASGPKSDDAIENPEFDAELVLLPSSEIIARDGDVNVSILHAVDGGGDCQNSLIIECSAGSAGQKSYSLGREKDRVRFLLPKDKRCSVRVESRLKRGTGDCQSGRITGMGAAPLSGAADSSDNALTMQQGRSSFRIQWEDRLAYAADGQKCNGGKGDQGACARLRAMDWNDGIWIMKGDPVR